MRKTHRLTMSQALVQHLAALKIESDSGLIPYVGGVFSIFGHGNVAGMGDALAAARHVLPTYRAHNEQGMANAAAAYSKAHFRERIMAVTTSIGPGATNLVTSAAMAHVNRLPMLLLPGDVFASKAPDPVLQQLECFTNGNLSVNDCLQPVTRYFARIERPEQILSDLPRAIQIMTDSATCGPVCLALPQDVQTQGFDCPDDFLCPEPLRFRRPTADAFELARAADVLRHAQRPLLIAGGGVLYSQAWDELRGFALKHAIPVAESQAGKSSLPWDHPFNLGAIGVTGSPAANAMAQEADVVFAVGTRLQDFTTGSNTLFAQARILSLNVQAFDANKRGCIPFVADVRTGIEQLTSVLGDWHVDTAWSDRARHAAEQWRKRVSELTTAPPPANARPYDAEVIGAVRDSATDSPANDIVVCAAGTLPAELHKLWRASAPGAYHVEYGFSTMGYEIAGGLGVKMAQPDREVIVMVGDGSYMMLNSDIATSVLLGQKLIVVVLDNRGYGCIHRLQKACGGEAFNNMLVDCIPPGGSPSEIDFAAHAASMGAEATHVHSIGELLSAMARARSATRTQVIVIDTTAERTTSDGGHWWEVAITEVSNRPDVQQARARYTSGKQRQRL